jgi:hypothetical protein
MARNKIEFTVNDVIQTEIRRYWNSPIKFNYINNQIGPKIEDILNMPDEDLKVIFCELIKRFATPKSGGGGRKFSLDL